jgi:hypothetical protein
MSDWEEKLCDERHQRIDVNVTTLYTKHENLAATINGKFNKILFLLVATLLSVIASLFVVIVTRPPVH